MNKEDMKEKYKERLKKILGKKIETTMIYSLSQFEDKFGSLWGDKLPEEELSDDQKEARKKWKICRENILDLGNRQRRNLESEINQYEVNWLRYQTILIPVEKFRNKI